MRVFRRFLWVHILGFGLLVCLSCGSDGGHTLVVQLRTDLVSTVEFEQIELTLLPVDESGTSKKRMIDASPEGYLPEDTLAEIENVATDSYRLGVSLLDKEGRSLVERPLLLEVQGNTAVTVPITRSCLNVSCAEDEACFGGSCVDARCAPENPEFCGNVSLCENDEDCSPEAACASGECRFGVCWAVSSDEEESLCATGIEWCSPEVGCVPLEASAGDPGTLEAAGFRLVWHLQAGGEGNDDANDIVATDNGGAFVVGGFFRG